MTLKWPKGAIGLLLRPKACLEEPFGGSFFIMHKYDGGIPIALSQLTVSEKIEAICQLSQGLATLHDLAITHGDLHVGNVFYDKIKNRYDLGDFEYAAEWDDKDEFIEASNKDLDEFKTCIVSIIIGEAIYTNSCRKEFHKLDNLEEIIKLGFNSESSRLILDFINSDIKGAHETLQLFTKIKELVG